MTLAIDYNEVERLALTEMAQQFMNLYPHKFGGNNDHEELVDEITDISVVETADGSVHTSFKLKGWPRRSYLIPYSNKYYFKE